MKKLVVHIGYPKTATKSLQLNVLTPLLKQGKIEYLNHLEQGHPNHGVFSAKNAIAYILGRDPGANWQVDAQEYTKITKPVTVLSNEGISHVSEKYPTVTSSAGATRNAQKVHEVFSSYFGTIEIVMTIRAQPSLILSQYTQEYYNFSNYNPAWANFDTWFNDTFKKRNSQGLFLDYHAMFTAYVKYFGKENVHVLVYEDLLHDKQSFFRKLAKVLEVDQAEIVTLFGTDVRNKTRKINREYVQADPGDLHAKLFAIAHKIFRNKDSRVFRAAKKTARTLIPDKILKTKVGSGAQIRTLTDEEQIFTRELFNDSNQELIQDAELDKDKMMHYGYIK